MTISRLSRFSLKTGNATQAVSAWMGAHERQTTQKAPVCYLQHAGGHEEAAEVLVPQPHQLLMVHAGPRHSTILPGREIPVNRSDPANAPDAQTKNNGRGGDQHRQEHRLSFPVANECCIHPLVHLSRRTDKRSPHHQHDLPQLWNSKTGDDTSTFFTA